MSVATAWARARVLSMTTISRATPRMISANTQAAPTEPAPTTPSFIIVATGLSLCCNTTARAAGSCGGRVIPRYALAGRRLGPSCRDGPILARNGLSSELLQQPIDIVTLDLGPAPLAGAPTQLVEDPLGLLDGVIAVGSVTHAHAAAVIDAAIGVILRVQPAERVALGLALTLAIPRFAAVGLAVAGLPHHLLGHAARGLLQLVKRVRLRDVAGLLAPLPHHLAELAAQRILLAGHIAVARLAACLRLAVLPRLTLSPLLPLLALLPLLLLALLPLPRLAEAAVEQLLLAAHHLLHLPHRLPFAALHLARAGHLEVFQHLLELREHVAGGIA